MTYSQVLNDIKPRPGKYQTLSDVFFPSFLKVQNIPKHDIADKEKEIATLLALLEKKLLVEKLSKAQKIDLIDYIEQLQVALEILAVSKGKKDLNNLRKAALHLGPKMQSSEPSRTKKGTRS